MNIRPECREFSKIYLSRAVVFYKILQAEEKEERESSSQLLADWTVLCLVDSTFIRETQSNEGQ